MRKHDFTYFFGEGMRNMFSHGFMSFAAVGITVACLVVMGTFFARGLQRAGAAAKA